jgi:hypothetical protein
LFCFAEGFRGVPPPQKNSVNRSNNTPFLKAFVLLRRRFVDPNLGEADPGGFGGRAPQKIQLIDLTILFFFQKKKQKAFVLLRRRFVGPNLGEADPGGFGGRAPQKIQLIDLTILFFFQKKKQKAFVLLRRRFVGPNLGEADPGGFGGRAPHAKNPIYIFRIEVSETGRYFPITSGT